MTFALRNSGCLERAAMSTAGFGVAAHLLVGLLDEHRLVLHPVGALTLPLLWVWALAAALSVLALARARGRAPFAAASLILACLGALLIYTV
jgi:hypothetical protein